ncbi:MAG: ATP-binding protein, partial [Candidatus Contubernalis sp.]|nr:ATP-binding protein [Candidatus Contubernalis sp.]
DQEPEDLYDVINERHEKGSTILTSNRAYSEWPDALGDPLIASAVLDRLAYNSHRIEITGKSYRTKNSAKYASVGKKEKEETTKLPSHKKPEKSISTD